MKNGNLLTKSIHTPFIRGKMQLPVNILSGYKLELFIVGVFAQFLGLLKIITSSIWNDQPYLEAKIIKQNDK